MIEVHADRREVLVRPENRGSAAVRRLAAQRLVLCPDCRRPLEVEVDMDLLRASEGTLPEVRALYDPRGCYEMVAGRGTTLLLTAGHRTDRAGGTSCRGGGIYLGHRPVGAYACAWARVVRLMRSCGRPGDARRSTDPPADLDRLFGDDELVAHTPVPVRSPDAIADVAGIEAVVDRDRPWQPPVFLLRPETFDRHHRGPFAPERLVAALGGAATGGTAAAA